jgi:beta-lactamase superfamily II metal-dependent hydrolase
MSTRATTKKAAGKAKRPSTKKMASKKRPATKKAVKKSASAKKSAGSKSRSASTANRALGLKVRMYRVGFGDFFLLTIPTRAGERYILIDCGVFKGTSGTGDIGSIEEAVEDLYKTTGGHLSLVIMTHRHADHIAGFSRAERFQDFTASMVWMPYWEKFNDAKDSPHQLQFEIEQLAMQLAMQFRGRTDEAAQQALDLLWDATGIDFNAAAKGAKKGGNAAALDLLKNHFGDKGRNVRYYAAGDEPELPPELKGLSAEILGPPPKKAQAFMKLTDLKKGIGQYLDSTTGTDDGVKAIEPFSPQWQADPGHDYPAKDARGFPIRYGEIKETVNHSQPDMLVAAAKKIDTFLNNQSLVVLFKFAGKKLLFVGDAQAGNWEYWLYDIEEAVKDPTLAGDLTAESQEILQTIDFYKVGHHGSTNSTPIQVVEALAKDHSPNGIVAMCSTEIGVYGNSDKGTEVPRDPLMKALGDECALIRSDSFAIKTKSSGVIKPAKGAAAPLPKPKVGKLIKKDLYVEYCF